MRTANRLTHAIRYARKLKQNRAKSGFVYVVQCQEYVKIGLADNVKLRVSGLQTGSPYKLKLLASWPCDDAPNTEKELHKLFSRFHMRGEWFKLPDDILAVVVALKDITQLPPASKHA